MSATETKGTALITGASSGMGAIYAGAIGKLDPMLRSSKWLFWCESNPMLRFVAWISNTQSAGKHLTHKVNGDRGRA